MPKSLNAKGKPTVYGFSCGAIQERFDPMHGNVQLWREHGIYHVRAAFSTAGRLWKSTYKLGEARRWLRKPDLMKLTS